MRGTSKEKFTVDSMGKLYIATAYRGLTGWVHISHWPHWPPNWESSASSSYTIWNFVWGEDPELGKVPPILTFVGS